MHPRERWTREVERIHTRYQTEVVEAFGFCPWAKEARCAGRVRMQVSFMVEADPVAALELIQNGMREPELEVAMLIFPLLPLSPLEFAHFVADVRAADELRAPRGQQSFALADFHPKGRAGAPTPHALVPFLRRSPDPMIQSVRTSVLAHVRGEHDHGTSYIDSDQLAALALGQLPEVTPPLATRLAQHNLRTVQRVGMDQLENIFRSIQDDRARSYSAIGLFPPSAAQREDTYSAGVGNTSEKK